MSLVPEYESKIDIKPDFEGWIVKYNVKRNKDCLKIAKGAFDKQKDKKIPIIVKVAYDNLVNIGECITEYFENGIYGRCYLKDDQKVAQDILDKVERGILTHFNIRIYNDAGETILVSGGMMIKGEIKSIDIVDWPNAFNTDTSINIINKKVSKDYEISDDEKTEYYKKVTLTKDDIKDPHDFHALPWTVDVLGTRYNIKSVDPNTDDKRLEDANGYCDYYAKEIVAKDYTVTERSFKDIPSFNRRVLRHEIVHAFLAESGLRGNCNWAHEEEMIDWIAVQFPKMLKAFKEAGALNSEDLK